MSTFEQLYDITVRKHLNSDALVFFEEKTRKIMTFKEFDETVDKFANKDLLVKDVNGNWRRKDLI